MHWWLWIACQNEGELPSLKEIPKEVLEDTTIPPMLNHSLTREILQKFQSNTQYLSLHRTCLLEGENEPPRWVFYSWHPDEKIALVVEINGVLPRQLTIDQTLTLNIATRDAFLMVEVGEDIPANFCVSIPKEIPISTVLESVSGQVQISRKKEGWSLDITEVLYKDQYSNEEWLMPKVRIPNQLID